MALAGVSANGLLLYHPNSQGQMLCVVKGRGFSSYLRGAFAKFIPAINISLKVGTVCYLARRERISDSK
jgi:hypothetical protein